MDSAIKFRDQQRRHGTSRGSGGGSVVMTVLSAFMMLVVVWLTFLGYCWYAGILQGEHFDSQTLRYVDKVLNETESVIEHLHMPHMADMASRGSGIHLSKDGNNDNDKGKLLSRGTVAEPKVQVRQKKKEEIHVVFSTDCTPYQDWQTIVLFHSATVVGQEGGITRIASGCDDEKKKKLVDLYAKLYPDFGVHFTPDFKKDEKTKKKYDFYNKPWGVRHWLDHAEPAVADDVVVALLDPDMIFLRPLTVEVRSQNNNIFAKRIDKNEIIDRVVEGRPVAQLYGLGAPWTNDNHKKFNRHKICGEGSPCLEPNDYFGARHYSVGPPYIAHKADLSRITETWTKFVPRVYEGYPYLLAEMYAYSMAAAHEKLPHLQVEHHMVSNVDVDPGEGWPWVDQLSDGCVPPDENGIFYKDQPLPTVMHYCQFFRAGEIGFQKRRVPKDIFSCDQPMMMEPPIDLSHTDYRVRNGKIEKLGPKAVKRNAFAICVIHRSINAAVIDYKKRMCGENDIINMEKTVNVNPNKK